MSKVVSNSRFNPQLSSSTSIRLLTLLTPPLPLISESRPRGRGPQTGIMSVDEPTFQALLSMGIEAPIARKAATMFTKADAAVEWCFGDGVGVSDPKHRRPLLA